MSKAQLFPTDEHGNALNRAMGLPIVSDTLKVGGPNFVDIFDLSQYQDRVFEALMVFNPDGANQLQIAIGDDFNTNKVIVVAPGGSMVFDEMTFGFGYVDPISKVRGKKVRAKLSATSGTLATGTINYHNGGAPIQPTDGMCVFLNGKVYEFSSDLSKATTSDFLVSLGATADLSWTALVNAIKARTPSGTTDSPTAGDQAITASIDTTTDIITITSEYGGTTGNSIAIADGDALAANLTAAVFSGAALTGGLSGVTPIIHVQ